jgi:hypothetical protein
MKKFFRTLLICLGVLLLAAGAFLLYVHFTDSRFKNTDQISAQLKALSPRTVAVEGVALYPQPDAYTCGITTISVTAAFLRQEDLPPALLMEKHGEKGGMKAERFAEILSGELPEYHVDCLQNLGDAELIGKIHEQLKNGVPVPVFFGAANPYNKPFNDFHASVVTGLDLDKSTVRIANVYGFEEQISLNEFLSRMAYRGPNYPFVQKVVLRLGLMPENVMFQITRK